MRSINTVGKADESGRPDKVEKSGFGLDLHQLAVN
jgi:hypothetical protein